MLLKKDASIKERVKIKTMLTIFIEDIAQHITSECYVDTVAENIKGVIYNGDNSELLPMVTQLLSKLADFDISEEFLEPYSKKVLPLLFENAKDFSDVEDVDELKISVVKEEYDMSPKDNSFCRYVVFSICDGSYHKIIESCYKDGYESYSVDNVTYLGEVELREKKVMKWVGKDK